MSKFIDVVKSEVQSQSLTPQVTTDEVTITKNTYEINEDEYINTHISKEWLPSVISDYMEDVAKRLNLPFEASVTTGLAFLSNLISDKLSITLTENENYLVIPNLWGCIIADPGSRKTPLFNSYYRPISTKNGEYVKSYNEELKKYEELEQIYQSKKKSLSQLQSKSEDDEKIEELKEELSSLEDRLEKKPKSRFLVFSDITKEQILYNFESNKHGFLLFYDELAKLLYLVLKESELRTVCLDGWSGLSSKTLSRVGKGTIHISRITLGVFGGIQKEIYRKLVLDNDDNTSSGFNARFQLVYLLEDSKFLLDNTKANYELIQSYESIVYKLIDFDLAKVTSAKKHPYLDTHFLELDSYSKDIVKNFLEKTINNGSYQHPKLKGYFRKIDKLLGGLIVTLHTIEIVSSDKRPTNNIIDKKIVKNAIELTKFYIGQNLKAFNIDSILEYEKENEFELTQKRVLSYMLNVKLPIKVRDVYRRLNITKKVFLQIVSPYYVIKKEGRSDIILSQKSKYTL